MELFLIEAFQEILKRLIRCLFHSEEGYSIRLSELARGELLNKLVMKLAKRIYGPEGEFVVPIPDSVLQNHGKGSAENVVSNILELHCGLIIGDTVRWI